MRCPGPRKLINAFKKGPNCVIVPVEYFASQTCVKIYILFDSTIWSHRFKVCSNSRWLWRHPTSKCYHEWSFRKLATERRYLNRSTSTSTSQPLHSKLMDNTSKNIDGKSGHRYFRIYCRQRRSDSDRSRWKWRTRISTVAAKCIPINFLNELHENISSGYCELFGLPMPETLQRPPKQ